MQKGIMITSNYRIVALDKLNVMVQKYSPSKEVVDKEGNKRVNHINLRKFLRFWDKHHKGERFLFPKRGGKRK